MTIITAARFEVGQKVKITARPHWNSVYGARRYFDEGGETMRAVQIGSVGEVRNAQPDGAGDISVAFDSPVGSVWIAQDVLSPIDSVDIPATAAPVRAFEVGDRVMVLEASYVNYTGAKAATSHLEPGQIVGITRLPEHPEAGEGNAVVDGQYLVALDAIALLDVEPEDAGVPERSLAETVRLLEETEQARKDAIAQLEQVQAQRDRLQTERDRIRQTLEDFRTQVAEAVVEEAERQDWCHRTEEWLDELGLSGYATRARYEQGSVALLNDGSTAVRIDNDDEPWHVFNKHGSRTRYASDREIRKNLKALIHGDDE